MDTIRLPRPATSTPVETAMAARHTSREFAARELSDQHLSDLLWAMYGVNRPDGKYPSTEQMDDYIRQYKEGLLNTIKGKIDGAS